jgi:hypothetical protein
MTPVRVKSKKNRDGDGPGAFWAVVAIVVLIAAYAAWRIALNGS